MQTRGPARGEIQSPGPGRVPPLKGQAQPEGSEGSQRGLITLGVSSELDQLGETTCGAERLRLDRRQVAWAAQAQHGSEVAPGW